MSKRIKGRLVSLAADGQRTGLRDCRISVRDYGTLELGHGDTSDTGAFDFPYDRRNGPGPGASVEVVAHDKVGRRLPFVNIGGKFETGDVAGDVLDVGELVIREADAKGVLVTLDTGQVARHSTGNTVRVLVDDEVFVRSAELIKTARALVLMSQLYFALPEQFHNDPSLETPELIFDLHNPNLDVPRQVRSTDDRPERLLIQAAQRGVDVRLLMHAIKIPWFIKLLVGLFCFPFAGSDGVRLGLDRLSRIKNDLAEVTHYFGQGAPAINVRGFHQDVVFDDGVMHLKALQADDRAVSIGSPLGQSYNDTPEHRIDSWMRGDESGHPKHDVGFEAEGPMTEHWYQTLKLLWDTSGGEPLPASPPASGPDQPMLDGTICNVQVVRTLSRGVFPGMPDGEKGILEAYFRAFAAAKDYIYLETQYFTNPIIADALVKAIKATPQLQVIMMVPIKPDPWAYPWQQRRMIRRIRKELGKTPGAVERFGVFTRWSHQPATAERQPRIMPVYIHSKIGVVDESWATVGSANLDGFSLDSSSLTDNPIARGIFRLGEMRAIEGNANMMNSGLAHEPSMAREIREKLWQEHLGLTGPLVKPSTGGWLRLWSDRAAQTLQQLRTDPGRSWTGLAGVLPWPPLGKHADQLPAAHLRALDVDVRRLFVVAAPRTFDFKSGLFNSDLPKRDLSHAS